MNVYRKYESVYRKYEKEILFAAVALFFFIVYPIINYMTMKSGADAHILNTYYDTIIPFVPLFIIPYISGFVMPMLLYFFIKDIVFFRKAVVSYCIMLCISYIIYIVYPVKVVLRPAEITGFFAPVFHMFYPFDPPYNAFPSLHVAQPFFAALLVYHYDKKYWWMIPWAALIVLSTIFTKQHYILDVASGLLLTAIVYGIFMKIRNI